MKSCMASRKTRSAGFTLIELILAITLLALMMGMVYTALNVGIRAWDAGDARVAQASNWRLAEHFLRRELGQLFPTRWRGTAQPAIALEGTKTSLRYVTSLNLDAAIQNGSAGGLQWAELGLGNDGVLMLNRQPFDSQASSFDGLNQPTREQIAQGNVIAPVRLMEAVTALEIAYFGSDNDVGDPTWRDEWRDSTRMPRLIRFTVETSRGRDVPPLIVSPRLGEEAGCLNSNFTRNCGPRPR
jgi:general secretion pathway protein J